MGKPHPLQLWRRVVAHFESGNTHHSTASRLYVSIKFVNDIFQLRSETGAPTPQAAGPSGQRKANSPRRMGAREVCVKGEITLDDMSAGLDVERDVRVDPSSVWRLFQRLGMTHSFVAKLG